MAEIKIPYGKSDFKEMRRENFVYVDKTTYLEKLEDYPSAMYVRPRSFGKTLFTNMLSCYYDIAERDDYEKIFKGLYVYDHPLKNRNNYYILNFYFAGVNAETSSSKEMKFEFNQAVLVSCEDFISKYNLDIQIEERAASANVILRELLAKFKRLNKENKIYIIIDEYDHFTNSLLDGDIERFKEVTKRGGFVRSFYEVIKKYSDENDSIIARFRNRSSTTYT